jgi:5-amino-6-(5-phosphoribosylamino)uracil reductase
VIVIACHVATFTIATAAIGERVPALQLLSLAFVVLLGASIPLNIGGWGPREGVAGWAFAVAGLGASAGVAASTLFGVLAIISVAPGAIATVVFAARVRSHRKKLGEVIVTDNPYVTLSCATSLDGYLDRADPPRLALSSEADFDRVDDVRARNDAILVGARTVRRDNPRLLVRSTARQVRRESAGLASSPWKVTVTTSGELDPEAAFFTAGDATKLVYCPSPAASRIRRRIGHTATVVGLGTVVTMTDLVADLAARGIRNLMVEGGGTVHTQFLAENLVDELHLAVAPFFVGDHRAPRFVGDAAYPWTSERRAALAEVRQMGDMVLLRYALSERFAWEGVERLHPSSTTSLVVGVS